MQSGSLEKKNDNNEKKKDVKNEQFQSKCYDVYLFLCLRGESIQTKPMKNANSSDWRCERRHTLTCKRRWKTKIDVETLNVQCDSAFNWVLRSSK